MSSWWPDGFPQSSTGNELGYDNPAHDREAESGGGAPSQDPDSGLMIESFRQLTLESPRLPAFSSRNMYGNAERNTQGWDPGRDLPLIRALTSSGNRVASLNVARGILPSAIDGLSADQGTAHVSGRPPVRYKLDGRTYNLWVVGRNGEDLLRPFPGHKISSVQISAMRESRGGQPGAFRRLTASTVLEQRNGRGPCPGAAKSDILDDGCTICFSGYAEGASPLGWTLIPPEGGQTPQWDGWHTGFQVTMTYRSTEDASPSSWTRVQADVIMHDVTAETTPRGHVAPTPYYLEGKWYNLWLVSEEGHNLLGSLNDLKAISIKITDNMDNRSSKTLKTFATYAFGYDYDGRGEHGQCWTGGKYVREERRGGKIELILSDYQPGEDLLSWTLTAPMDVWGGWYPEHQLEMSYLLGTDPNVSWRRKTKAPVILEPITDSSAIWQDQVD